MTSTGNGQQSASPADVSAGGNRFSTFFGSLAVLTALFLAAFAVGCAFTIGSGAASIIVFLPCLILFGFAVSLFLRSIRSIRQSHISLRRRHAAHQSAMPTIRALLGTGQGTPAFGAIGTTGIGIGGTVFALFELGHAHFDHVPGDFLLLLVTLVITCIGGFALVKCAEALNRALFVLDCSDPLGRSDNGL